MLMGELSWHDEMAVRITCYSFNVLNPTGGRKKKGFNGTSFVLATVTMKGLLKSFGSFG